MSARYGWDLDSWFGQFATVAASVLGCAFAGLLFASLLVVRYEARLADGDLRPPALRTLPSESSVYYLGASIGDIPGGGHVGELAGALQKSVPGLPWQRLLFLRSGDRTDVRTVFFPVNGVGEAFALCRSLAGIPPRCVPATVSTDALATPDGKPVSEDLLARMGIAPYTAPRGRPRVASLPRGGGRRLSGAGQALSRRQEGGDTIPLSGSGS